MVRALNPACQFEACPRSIKLLDYICRCRCSVKSPEPQVPPFFAERQNPTSPLTAFKPLLIGSQHQPPVLPSNILHFTFLPILPILHLPSTNVRSLQTHLPPLRRSPLVLPSTPPSTKSHSPTPHRKIPWRLSPPQKARQRKRLRAVDKVVACLSTALKRQSELKAASALENTTPAEGPLRITRVTRGKESAGSINPRDGDQQHQHTTFAELERWQREMPTESEMRPKDKYTMFDRKEKRYRKGVHSTSFFPLSFSPHLLPMRLVGKSGRGMGSMAGPREI